MWLCLNDAFLSIVDDGKVDGCLVVRARRKGDIEKLFPSVKVITLKSRDYQFRAHVSRELIAEQVAAQVMAIDYPNFKDSVQDNDLHDAYAGFWQLHARLQPKRPYMM